MGLDQYLYIFKKIKPELEKEIQFQTKDYLQIQGFRFIENCFQDPLMYDYSLEVPILTKKNINQIKKDAALNEDYLYLKTVLLKNGIEVYFSRKEEIECVTLSLKHFNEIVKKTKKFCNVILMEPMKYWRNNWDLNNELDCYKNCSWYKIDESNLPSLKKHFDEREEEDKEIWSRVEDIVLNHKDDMAVFYYAWW